MGAAEIQAFMSYLANERKIAGATYTQALRALLSLYKKVLKVDLPWIGGISRHKKPARRPTVLTRQEVQMIFTQMSGVYGLIARLLYGTGMRLMKCAQFNEFDAEYFKKRIVEPIWRHLCYRLFEAHMSGRVPVVAGPGLAWWRCCCIQHRLACNCSRPIRWRDVSVLRRANRNGHADASLSIHGPAPLSLRLQCFLKRA
jgi:Phage integrase, N-terminal SAM-like domain